MAMFSAPTRSAWSVGVSPADALEFRLRGAVLLSNVRTVFAGAGAGGVARVHRDQLATGAVSLVREGAQEHPPTRVVDVLVQPGLRCSSVREKRARVAGVGLGFGRADHVRDAQPFVRDHVVLADYRQGGLVRVILPLAAHLAMQRGDLLHRTAMPGGSVVPLAPGERRHRALGVGEGIGGALAVPGVWLVRALGCGEEVGDAHVDTGHRTGRGEWFGGHLVTGEDDVPLPALALDADRLDPACDGPGLGPPNVPHPLHAA